MFHFVDRWIDRVAGISDFHLSEAENLELLTANLMGRVQPGAKILLTGDVSIELLESLQKKLQPCLDGITLVCGEAVNVSAASLNVARGCDGVVLIVKRKQSTTLRLENQLEYLKDLGKPVYGFVMV